MSLLTNLTTDSTIADEKDILGGGGPVDSGLYTHTISLAYLMKSAGGAVGMVLNLKDSANREVRQTLWMSSGTAKGGKNFYERNGERNYLPGFVLANSLCLLTVGKEIHQMDTETKVVNVYSYDAKAEVPTKVEMVMDLLGQEILTGLIKQTVDKNVKDASGNYVASGETRDENEIDKFFRATDRMTTAEIRARADKAAFADAWEQQWAGKTRERAKRAAAAGVAGIPSGVMAGATKKPTTSLFATA